VEFMACKPEIEKLRNEGHSKRLIYDFLTEQGKIRMKYRMFCRYIQRLQSAGKKPASPVPVSAPGRLPVIRSQTLPAGNLSEPGTPFFHDRKAHDSNDFERAE
jgi:hypothetical protein